MSQASELCVDFVVVKAEEFASCEEEIVAFFTMEKMKWQQEIRAALLEERDQIRQGGEEFFGGAQKQISFKGWDRPSCKLMAQCGDLPRRIEGSHFL